MPNYVCRACGTAFPEAITPLERCVICDDERQYVPAGGQQWTTPEELSASHSNSWRRAEPGLFEIRTIPTFGIGQRAFLLRTPTGNILWDCIALLDEATVELVRALDGLSAIAISHPHYYTRMQDWARAFDVPVYLHAFDRQWVVRNDSRLTFWEGDTFKLDADLTLLRLGGHFPGGSVLHWPGGANGRGVLLTGDVVQVAADTSRVSFLWSYPNMMPLSAASVQRIGATLEAWKFDRIYGAFAGREILADAGQSVRASVARYTQLLDDVQR